ncbi:MAG: glycosyltransferase involved in cell wall biosynthesis [Saprospiraceae bacterium]|jgi:glycosyltransferase involved in cell wall biosynthesis
MKILFITHKYPPIIGGMEKQSYELITRVAKSHDVIVHAYKGEGSKLKWFLILKKKIKKILAKHKDIQVIHVNDGLMTAATLWLNKYTEIPVVATFHGLDITFPSTIFQKRIVKKMHNLDGAICVSRATTEACLQRGFDKTKVYTVLNGVDHDLAEIDKEIGFLARVRNETGVNLANKKVIMTMGRAVKRKGFSWFLKNVMPGIGPGVVFLMVGPLNTKPGLGEKVINNLPAGIRSKFQLMLGMATDVNAITEALESQVTKDKVHHMGKVSFSDLMQYLAIADVFVMPNIEVEGDAEGFGLVALEASLRGTPVIAAGIEGITDAVRDGNNGILLPSADARKWIDTINTLIKDEDRLAKLSKSAIDSTLKNYGWDKMVTQYLAVFEKVIMAESEHIVVRK